MNHTKIVFWLNICLIVGMSQSLIGKDYISYYDRKPMPLEDFVYRTVGKSYSVESDFIDEQQSAHIALGDKDKDAAPKKTDDKDNQQNDSDHAAQSQPNQIQYAPAINDLPFADSRPTNHQAVEIRSIPKNEKSDESFEESEYVHVEDRYRGTSHSDVASLDNHTTHTPTSTYVYHSKENLNPGPAEFYFTTNKDPASEPVEKVKNSAEQNVDTNSQSDKINSDTESTKPDTDEPTENSPDLSMHQIKPMTLETPAKNEKPTLPKNENPTRPKSNERLENEKNLPPTYPEIAMTEKIPAELKNSDLEQDKDSSESKDSPLEHEKESPALKNSELEKVKELSESKDSELKKDVDLVAYAGELDRRSLGCTNPPERTLRCDDEDSNLFEGICFDNSCRDYCGLPEFCLFIDYTLGKGVGYPTGYTSIGLWSALNSNRDSQFQPFIDLRGHVLNNGQKAANIGLGARYLSTCLNTIFGASVYYDYREGFLGHYNQIGVGAEILGKCWDFRINGYIPVGKRDNLTCCLFEDYDGDYFALFLKKERSLGGFDAEVGAFLRRKDPCCCCDFDVYAAIGPYYFSTNCGPNVFGGQARLAVGWLNCINVEVIATSDRVFHERVQGRFELCIPLGGNWCCWGAGKEDCGNCSCWPRCVDCLRVERREIIVLDDCCEWETNYLRSSSQEFSNWGSDREFRFSDDFESGSFSRSRSSNSR